MRIIFEFTLLLYLAPEWGLGGRWGRGEDEGLATHPDSLNGLNQRFGPGFSRAPTWLN